jgi:hypothetical protein
MRAKYMSGNKQVLFQALLGLLVCYYMQGGSLHAQALNNGRTSQDKKLYNAEWDFYFSSVDDKLGSIAVDLGLHDVAPIQNKGNVAWLSIKLNSPREDGLTTTDESALLGQIEDKVVEKVSSA